MYTPVYPSFISQNFVRGSISARVYEHGFDEQHDAGINWG